MKVLALYSIKGGVGKTVSAVNLSAQSALHGYRLRSTPGSWINCLMRENQVIYVNYSSPSATTTIWLYWIARRVFLCSQSRMPTVTKLFCVCCRFLRRAAIINRIAQDLLSP